MSQLRLTEEKAIRLTMEYGFDGKEFDTVTWKDKGFLKKTNTVPSLLKKLNILYESVELEGDGSLRVYILDEKRKIYTLKQAIDITIEHGYDGEEFELAKWKRQGNLEANHIKKLAKKLETIYSKVEVFGKGSPQRHFELDGKKKNVKLDKQYIKKKPKKKTKLEQNPIDLLTEEERQYIEQQKQQFISEYFIKKVKKFDTNKTLSEIRIEPRENIPRTLIFKLFNQYKVSFNYDWHEYISVVVSLVTEAIHDYKPKKPFDWSTLNVPESKSNLHLKTHIARRLEQRLVDEARKANGQTYGQETVLENGEKVKKRTIINKPENSTDAVIDDGEKNKTPLINTLSNELIYGGVNKELKYFRNHFLTSFHENKNKQGFLTKNLIEYLEEMPKYLHDDGSSYTIPYNSDPTQKYNMNQRTGNRREINRRVTEHYNKEFPKGKITSLQMEKEKNLAIIDDFMKIAKTKRNKKVTEWIVSNLDNSLIGNLIYDGLGQLDTIDVVTSYYDESFILTNRTIHNITELIRNKRSAIHSLNTDKPKKRLKSSHSNVRSKKEIREKRKRELAFRNDKYVQVYDLKGNWIRQEENPKPDTKNYRVYQINTYGVRIAAPTDREDEEMNTHKEYTALYI